MSASFQPCRSSQARSSPLMPAATRRVRAVFVSIGVVMWSTVMRLERKPGPLEE